MTWIKRCAVEGASTDNGLACLPALARVHLFKLAVMKAAKGAHIGQRVGRRCVINVRSRLDMVAHKGDARAATGDDALPTVALMTGALESAPVRGIVIAIAGHWFRQTGNKKGGLPGGQPPCVWTQINRSNGYDS